MVACHKQCYQVYIEFAERLIQAGRLDVLSLCQFPNVRPTPTGCPSPRIPEYLCDSWKLPPWTPDWSTRITAPNDWFMLHGNSLFSASAGSSPKCSFNAATDPNNPQCRASATLTGVLVDEIVDVRLVYARGTARKRLENDFLFGTRFRERQQLCKASRTWPRHLLTFAAS